MENDTMVISRVTEGQCWHALDDDEVVARGDALRRPDGRVFLSVDTWRDDVFQQVVEAILADLPAPHFTVVDDDDREVLARWRAAGFQPCRRELEYVLATDPPAADDDATSPAGVVVLPPGALTSVREAGIASASADVDERNVAARALFRQAGGRPAGGTLELRHD